MRLQLQSCWCVALLVQLLGAGLSECSLQNSFPFTEARPARQGTQDQKVDFKSVAAAGKQCIDKIVMEEETEYDEEYTCDHSYNQQCTTSYTTVYEAQQEEECEENFQKDCFIEYAKTAQDVEVEICVEPLVKDCSVPGPEVCSTEYQSECETIQERHEVEDDVVECSEEVETKCEDVTSGYTSSQECSKWPVQKCNVVKKPVVKTTPQTSCQQVAVELCGPSSCPAVSGPQECRVTTRTIAGEKPEEQCSLEPRRSCKHVTKLVPQLKPHESCLDVPKEVCVRSQTNPRKVQKPVVKRWCYTPTKESGLPVFSSPPQGPDKAGAVQESSLSNAQQCPQSCIQAQQSGVCDPRCNQYASICGTRPCQPTTTTTTPPPPSCPASCQPRYQSSGVCDLSCNQYAEICGIKPCQPTTTPPPPSCPASCRPGYQTSGVCNPSCNQYASLCGINPCQPTTTTTTTTPPPPTCPSSCRPGYQSNGVCEPQCDVALCGYDPDCDPPPFNPPPPPTFNPPPPTLAPQGYLPPPPEAGRSAPNLSSRARSPSRALPLRPQFGRKQSQSVGLPRAVGRTRATPAKLQQRGGRGREEETGPVRNNWDLYFRNGIIKRKSG